MGCLPQTSPNTDFLEDLSVDFISASDEIAELVIRYVRGLDCLKILKELESSISNVPTLMLTTE